MEPMQALSQLGLAGAVIGGSIFLLRELKKLGNGKLDQLFAAMAGIDQRLDRIEQQMAYKKGVEEGVEAERSGRWQVPPPPKS